MEVIGYKCFNEDLTNSYGKKFAIGQIYITTGALKFGNNGNGFHLCKNIEDILNNQMSIMGIMICIVYKI